MRRKIVQQGKSSMNISIPVRWVNRHGFSKGDEIEISEKGEDLVLHSGKEIDLETKEINVEGLDEVSIKWYLISLYCSGYDSIKVVFGDHDQIYVIQDKIRNLLGYNIMEQRSNYCIIRSISKPVEEEFEPSLKRIFQVVLSMSESTLEALKDNDKKAFRSILTMESTCNRITYFCMRLLNKNGYETRFKTTYMYNLINRLENIADAYANMMLRLEKIEGDITLKDDVHSSFKQTNLLLRKFYDAFYKCDAMKVRDLASSLQDDYDNLMSQLRQEDDISQSVVYFLNLIRNYIGESIVSVLSIRMSE